MDNVLLPYITATDDRERQRHLDELLTLRAAPLIRQVLRRKLGFYVSAQGVNKNNQDAEDLYQEVMSRVVHGLNRLQTLSGTDIENFELYASRIAANVCTDFIRAKSPERTRLKYRLRYLLRRHSDLASWEYDNQVLCGFAKWRKTGKRAISPDSIRDVESELDVFRLLKHENEDLRLVPLTQIVADIFNWIGGPLEMDLLVRMIAYLLDLKDQPIESFDDQSRSQWDGYSIAGAQSDESHLETAELLTRLWRAVIRLPAEQRDVFALGFEDHDGHDLFTVLLAAEVVNWDELARGVDRPIQEVVRLRLRMPMDNAELADELKASREHVYKWRFRALRRLKAELSE